ncbi:MAG: hypothetical protein ACLPPF_11295 [Rhodomicrobium sp.]
MTKRSGTETRDEVLFAFHETCERPSPEVILEWTTRYPEFAEDIREHAEQRLAWLAREDHPGAQVDDGVIARGWSRTLNAIYHAEKEEEQIAEYAGNQVTLAQLIEDRGTTIPALARQIDIDRLVLGELNAGRMRLPVGGILLSALLGALNVAQQRLDDAISRSAATPALGQAKANKSPSVILQSYEEVVLRTSMSEEQKRYWLGQDTKWTPGKKSD